LDNIYLIGYMGAGKSTIGKTLAATLSIDFVDLDTLIETRSGLTIPDIFDRYGELRFRLLEASAVHHTRHLKRCVIATGGGTPCHHHNLDIMKDGGKVVYLRGSVELLLHRIETDQENTRPILRDMSSEERYAFITQHLAHRSSYYNLADHIVDISQTVDEVVNDIKEYSLQ